MTAATNSPTRSQPWRVVLALGGREIVRFLRQRNRVIGALGQPLLFWLLFGAGLQGTFRLTPDEGGPSFLEYYLPGTMVLILLFTAIFATISIIEDRREGFLQSVLVAPIPRWSMVLGKVMGGAILALGQALVFLLIALLMSARPGPWELLNLVALLLVSAIAITSFGFVLAWRMESTQGFHAIMNLLLMPMWLLSGSFFPIPSVSSDAAWGQQLMHWVMRLNPMTYCVSGVRRLLSPEFDYSSVWCPSLGICWAVTLIFAVLAFAAAWKIAETRTTGDLL